MVRVAPASSASLASPPARAIQAGRRIAARLCVLVLAAFASGAPARDFAPESVGVIPVARLPAEGRQVLAAIHAGGPFVSKRDGIVFGNRERQLPRRPRGYYAEYTVPTPGERTRGARRIIAGQGTTGDYRTSGEYYYTNDHYETFSRILQ